MSFAHGEGLSGQSAVEDNGGEQLILFHAGQDEADGVGLGSQLLGDILAVDIVDLAAILLQVGVQECLQGADLQLSGGVGHGDNALLAVEDIGDLVAFALTQVCAGVSSDVVVEQLLAVHVEQDAVDGLELQGVVMQVGQLDQSITSGVVLTLSLRQGGLQLFPAGLGGSQRVVAVAHSEGQDGVALCVVVLGETVGISQSSHLGQDLLGLLLVQQVAGDLTAALHQSGLIDHAHLGGSLVQGLDDVLVGVVDQDHDVGQLDGSIAADTHTGGNTLQNGALGGTDGSAGTLGVVILFQVQLADEAETGLAAIQLTLDIEQGVVQGAQALVLQVLLHVLVDLSNLLFHVVALQLALGQDQAQGRGSLAHVLVHTLPVLGLRGVLVAGDDGPLGQAAVNGQQDVCGGKSNLVHDVFLQFL